MYKVFYTEDNAVKKGQATVNTSGKVLSASTLPFELGETLDLGNVPAFRKGVVVTDEAAYESYIQAKGDEAEAEAKAEVEAYMKSKEGQAQIAWQEYELKRKAEFLAKR